MQLLQAAHLAESPLSPTACAEPPPRMRSSTEEESAAAGDPSLTVEKSELMAEPSAEAVDWSTPVDTPDKIQVVLVSRLGVIVC